MQLLISLVFLFSVLFMAAPVNANDSVNFSLRIISVSVCSDGIDNDGDGKTDYPKDSGCKSPNGDNEIDPSLWALWGKTTVTPTKMIKIFGKSAPASLTELLKDGFTIASDTADANGDFQFTVVKSVDSKNHTFAIVSADKNNPAQANIIPIDITSSPLTQTLPTQPEIKIAAINVAPKNLTTNITTASSNNQFLILPIIFISFTALVSLVLWGWKSVKIK